MKEFFEAQKKIREISRTVELTGNGFEELEEAFSKNLDAIMEEGFHYQDENGLKLKLISDAVPVYDKDLEEFNNFENYLNLLEGRHKGSLELKARDIRGCEKTFRQPVELDLNLPLDELTEIYQDLDQEFDVDRVGVSYEGLGSTYKEAFEDSRLLFSMFGTDGTGYRENILVELECLTPYLYARNIESDREENLHSIYTVLEDNPVYHNDVFIQDESQEEWIVAQKGFTELESIR